MIAIDRMDAELHFIAREIAHWCGANYSRRDEWAPRGIAGVQGPFDLYFGLRGPISKRDFACRSPGNAFPELALTRSARRRPVWGVQRMWQLACPRFSRYCW